MKIEEGGPSSRFLECFLRQQLAPGRLFVLVQWVDIHPPLSLDQSLAESWDFGEETQSCSCPPADGRETAKKTSWPLVMSVVETGTGALRAEEGVRSPQRC